MGLFDIYKAIYQKSKQSEEITNGILIVLNKWLSQDKDNLIMLRKLLPYLFYVEPIHYYYLLYYNIPKKHRVPYLKKKVANEETEPELLNKIKYVLDWSTKELEYNKPILEQTVLKNVEYWKGELGL